MSRVFPAFCPVHSGIQSSPLFGICRITSNCIWNQHTSSLILFMGLILAYTAHLFDCFPSKSIRLCKCVFLCIHWMSVCVCWQCSHVKGHQWKLYCTNFTLLESKSCFLHIFVSIIFLRKPTRESRKIKQQQDFL